MNESIKMTLEQVRDILRHAGRFDIYGTNEQACDLADALDAEIQQRAELHEALNWCVAEINRDSPAVVAAKAVLAKPQGVTP